MTNSPSPTGAGKIAKTDAARRAPLTGAPYDVLKGKKRWGKKRWGTFARLVGGEALLASDAHVSSGPGWPSLAHEDARLSRHQIKPRCARREAHLGRVFPDGGRASMRLRYCSNDAALHIKPGGT